MARRTERFVPLRSDGAYHTSSMRAVRPSKTNDVLPTWFAPLYWLTCMDEMKSDGLTTFNQSLIR